MVQLVTKQEAIDVAFMLVKEFSTDASPQDVADILAEVHQHTVFDDVANERERQDEKWGGPKHDDDHSTHDFCRWIKNYAGWADQMADGGSYDKSRRRLIQVAALAVAAIESIDRWEAERAGIRRPLDGGSDE